MAATQKIILIDDHDLVRAGVRSLIEELSGYKVVAEGDDGDQALRLLSEFNPNILILDIAMKRIDGLKVLPKIRESHPNLKIVLLSMHASKDYLTQAFNLGVDAYLLKDSAEIELELALKSVVNGEKYISPKLSQKLLDVVGDIEKGQSKSNVLTERQIQILTMLAQGKVTKQIAHELNVSSKTVEAHRAQIMERLDLHDLASLVKYAIKKKYVSLDD